MCSVVTVHKECKLKDLCFYMYHRNKAESRLFLPMKKYLYGLVLQLFMVITYSTWQAIVPATVPDILSVDLIICMHVLCTSPAMLSLCQDRIASLSGTLCMLLSASCSSQPLNLLWTLSSSLLRLLQLQDYS